MKQNIADHKPLVDKLNNSGAALLKLCGEKDAIKVQDMLDDDNRRMEDLRNGVRTQASAIEEALQQSAEVSYYKGEQLWITESIRNASQ